MNERMNELAIQAGLLPREIGPVVETRHMKKKQQDLEKFAELIVRECARIADKAEPFQTSDLLLKHFGVEG